MLIAVTRPVSASLERCELTHLTRESIDVARAEEQHAGYERVLASLGATIARVPAAPDLPDAVFIEDTAIVLDELVVITRPGAPSRRPETAAVAAVLAAYRAPQFIRTMTAPTTLDGGDVLRIGRTIYVGCSGRSNAHGIEQLREFVAPFGYHIVPVEFTGCLHLKSAVTEIADGVLLANPAWVSSAAFAGCETQSIDEREPHAANALRIRDAVVFPAQFPRTRERLVRRGIRVTEVDCSELAKAEGAVTCCSLVFETS
ncbi:MAG: dimethylarginine dimethylaminohydrolase family protein [Candidatus Eiseniibacteriota bacterium]